MLSKYIVHLLLLITVMHHQSNAQTTHKRFTETAPLTFDTGISSDIHPYTTRSHFYGSLQNGSFFNQDRDRRRLRWLRAVNGFALYNIIAGGVFFTAGTIYTVDHITNRLPGEPAITGITLAAVGGGAMAIAGGSIWRIKTGKKIEALRKKISVTTSSTAATVRLQF